MEEVVVEKGCPSEKKGGGKGEGWDPLRDDEGCIALHACIGFFPSRVSTCGALIDLEKKFIAMDDAAVVIPPLSLRSLEL